jgi:hypothetical protein
LRSYDCEAIVNGKLRFWPIPAKSVDINFETNASIIPFAQSEMVGRFIEGVDPSYSGVLRDYLKTLLENGYPGMLKQMLTGRVGDDVLLEIGTKLADLGTKLITDFDSETNNYRRQTFVNPILETVAGLPKDELAAMAESLVNLTSFKRKITSQEAETVGGPIDVAVISKGDGFIWIKRKHYFDPALNHSFFRNYYGAEEA